MSNAPVFDTEFRTRLADLFAWRRDVRRFRHDPVDEDLLDRLLDIAQLAPSVGNSQPWRIFRVASNAKRAEIRENFLACNDEALGAQQGERAALYARLKLEGIDVAPVQLAVFCDRATSQGHGLGSRTMPEMLDYSAVGMISTLWLAARATGLGLGWVSILDPERVRTALDAPPHFRLIAYLCLGWPEEEHIEPELARCGWRTRIIRISNAYHFRDPFPSKRPEQLGNSSKSEIPAGTSIQESLSSSKAPALPPLDPDTPLEAALFRLGKAMGAVK